MGGGKGGQVLLWYPLDTPDPGNQLEKMQTLALEVWSLTVGWFPPSTGSDPPPPPIKIGLLSVQFPVFHDVGVAKTESDIVIKQRTDRVV